MILKNFADKDMKKRIEELRGIDQQRSFHERMEETPQTSQLMIDVGFVQAAYLDEREGIIKKFIIPVEKM